MQIIHFLRKIKKSFSKYSHSVQVLIFKDNLIHNLNEYRSQYKEFLFAPVLKSNAYGHGLLEVAKILDKEKDIPFFVVDSLYEARVLSHHYINKDILIIGYTRLANIKNYNSKRFIFNIISLEELKNLSKEKIKKIRIHIKIDTGMHRQGILMSDIESAIQILKTNPNLSLEGISSHFADADSDDRDFTKRQIDNWEKTVNIFKREFKDIKYFHISASSGVDINKKEYGNLIRLGIGLYGFNVSNKADLNLKGVLRLESIISSLKEIEKGESVGYNHTYTTSKRETIAIVPVGYFEGVDRRLSNIGYFKIKNIFCPIVGRISMNLTSINISGVEAIKLEDKVIVISENKEDKNSILNIARLCDTIPYEVLVHISSSLRRSIL